MRFEIKFTIKNLFLEINRIGKRYFLILYFKPFFAKHKRVREIESKYVIATFGGSCKGELKNFFES